ncbi:hypothetical protein MZM54_05315 [[Brevibacterium] frigoritolerans]|nr:hypothetical protein [Peribacillus frigoritolerans]
MGSAARWNSINMFEKLYGNKLEAHFTTLLVGNRIYGFSGVEVSRYVKADVRINKEVYPVHYRWASVEEISEGVELEEEYLLFEEYYKESLHYKVIKQVVVAAQDRDDEVYLTCTTANNDDIQIPLGFDPERDEFSSYAEALLSDKEQEAYQALKEIGKYAHGWNFSYDGLETQAQYVEQVIRAIFEDPESIQQTYALSDFEKMNKISELFNQERVDCLELLEQIKTILAQ